MGMEGRVAIVHVFFGFYGGGEYLALNMAKALKEEGFDVSIHTCAPIDYGRVEKVFGIDMNGFKVFVRESPVASVFKDVVLGRESIVKLIRAFNRFFREYVARLRREYDVVVDTQSNMVSPVDITYIHYPLLMHLYRGNGLRIHSWLYGWFKRLYTSVYRNHLFPCRVLANSSWTASLVYKIYRIVPDIVYPPVDIEYFSRCNNNDVRDKLVVTISRFVEDKRLDRIVDVASKLRDYTFVIIGSTNEYSYRVISRIREKAREYRLDNIVIETNLPRQEILGYLEDARYYLHPERPEHFGIAIVEAMAAGLVPIVYRDGGAWYDIVGRVWGRLGYRVIDEVPGIIRLIDSNRGLYDRLRMKCVSVSRMFSYSVFREAIAGKVREILRVKRIALARPLATV